MDVREKLVELLGANTCKCDYCEDCEYCKDEDACIAYLKNSMADHLIAHGVTVQENCKSCSEATQNCIVKLQEQIAELRSVQEWISVKNRFPENICPVLVVLEGLNTAFNGWYHDGKWWTVGAGTRQFTQKVTHWMPLPQPPKGE